MRRYAIFAGVVAGLLLLLLLWPRPVGNAGKQEAPGTNFQTPAAVVTTPPSNEPATVTPRWYTPEDVEVARLIRGSEQERVVRSFNETANMPVAFYGQVVDQNTNPLQNVHVGVAVAEEYMRPTLETRAGSITNLQRLTGSDGRFEITGFRGRRVTVTELTKDGYEPELGIRGIYGIYGAQDRSYTDPVVFRMWPTNVHEQLITGDREFKIVPDGRHYAIDLMQGSISDGDEGDVVAWVRRPESVRPGERYEWSCEVKAPSGGLLESQTQAMFIAPEAGYTNVFSHEEKPDVNGMQAGSQEKHLYVRLRNDQMYGRITIGLYPGSYLAKSGTIRLSYAVNPSGSRLLR